MLSAMPLKSGSQATHYFFEKDNYYFVGEAELDDSTKWFGQGAKDLGLTGEIDREQFDKLLDGQLPTGDVLGRTNEGKRQHRPGYDLTFSAPKSISLLALIGGDKRLDEAHDKAVNVALSAVEVACAQARFVNNKKEIDFENTKNLVIAQFRHDTSRDLDPQRHTHCVVLNMTKRGDGKWRALASQPNQRAEEGINGFLERIYENKHYFGMIYRSQLAYEAQQLGYKIEITGDHGLFEIAGVDKIVLKNFSKRRQEIEAKLEEKGFTSAKAAAAATLATRKAKNEAVDRVQLREVWEAETKRIGIDLTQIINFSKDKTTQMEMVVDPKVALVSIHAALNHLSTFNIKIDHNILVNTAMRFTFGELKHTDILAGVEALQKSGQILTIIDNQKTYYTTNTLVEKEKHILNTLEEAKKVTKDIHLKPNDSQIVNSLCESDPNLMTFLEKNQSINLLLGKATKDNQNVMQLMVDLYEKSGMTVRILSPQNQPSSFIADNVKRRPSGVWQWLVAKTRPELSQTTAKFLYTAENDMNLLFGKHSYRNHVVLIDSTEKLNIDDMERLLKIQKQTGMQLIFIGDDKARGSAFASDSLSLLKTATVSTHEFNNDMNKPKPEPKISITVENQQKARYEAIAKEIATLTHEERQKAIVIAPNKKAQTGLNIAIHEVLHTDVPKHQLEVLLPVSMTDEERKYAKSYQVGMKILIKTDRSKIKNGEYATITDIQPRKNTLILQKGNEAIEWNLNIYRGGREEIFVNQSRDIAIGENIVFTKNYKNFSINKNTIAQVTKITSQAITFKTSAKTITLPRSEPLHFDYMYANTLDSPILANKDKVYIDLPSHAGSKQIMHQLGIQADKELRIYTDNIDRLTKTLSENKSKTTAINTLIQASGIARLINQDTKSAVFEDIANATKVLIKNLPKSASELTTEEITQRAFSFATEKLTSRGAAFTHKELLGEALAFSFGKTTIENIETLISEKRKSGDLILGRYYNDNTKWTTQEAVDLEKNIINSMNAGRGTAIPITKKSLFKEALEGSNLTPGQYSACEMIATSNDRFVLIQGYAGTGKSTLLQTLNDKILAARSGQKIELKTLAPTNQAVNELREKGLESQTLQSFIPDYERALKSGKVNYSNTVFVIDEASMVANNEWLKFVNIMNESNARVVVALGDKAQLSSIGAGKPFEIAQKAGFPMVELTDIVRQKTPELLTAVKSIIRGNYESAFNDIKNLDPNEYVTRAETFASSHSVIEVKPTKENENLRAQKIAEDYVTRTHDTREKTLIISHSHKGRKAINVAIQEQRLRRGELDATHSISTTILRPQSFTTAELKHTNHYTSDMVLRFSKAIPFIGIEKNSYWSIKSNSPEANAMTIVSHDDPNKVVIFEPSRLNRIVENGLEVYKPEPVTLHKNELIRFTRRDKDAEIYSNECGTISDVANKKVTITKGEKSYIYDIDKSPLHFDLGYSTTGYGAQGMTAPYVLTDEASYLSKLSNQRSLYVAISRGQVHVTVYTDNEKALLKKILQNAGDKLSALEVTGEIDNLSKVKPNHTKQQSNSKLKLKEPHYDARAIDSALAQQAENVAYQLLGDPNKNLSTPKNLRYGTKGSLSITLTGDKRGLWHNFETGEHGNLLTLVQKTANVSFVDALKIAAKMVGDPTSITLRPQQDNVKSPAPAGANKETSKTHEFALKLANESIPIEGTLAERYLREHRAIEHIDKGIDLRFHPAVYSSLNRATMPALLAVGHDKDGTVQTVQATYLDEKSAAKARDISVGKQTFGSPMGASISLTKPNGKADVTFVAEGAETGLSIAQAMPNQDVKVTLSISNFAHIDPNKTANTIVLCLDNDGDNAKSTLAIIKAGERLIEQGKEVWLTKPDKAKTDFNDVLKKDGRFAILAKLNSIQSFTEFRDKLTLNLAKKAEADRLTQQSQKLNSIKEKAGKTDRELLKMADQTLNRENKIMQERLSKTNPNNLQKSAPQPAKIPSINKGFERDFNRF